MLHGESEIVAVTAQIEVAFAPGMELGRAAQSATDTEPVGALLGVVDDDDGELTCLRQDEQSLFSFYAFPAAHWVHLRTSNPIESTYATVRLRTKRTKGCGSRTATLTMVWKLALEAEKTWRRLMGFKLIPLVMAGREFVDGELIEAVA